MRPARASRYHRLLMKQAVFRERNKNYYRVLHTPIWIWVFWVLPGYPLTYDLYTHGPELRHWVWLAIVMAVVFGADRGRIPGCESVLTSHYGVHQPNLPYRVVCYTSAWNDLLVPYTLNLIGLIVAPVNGRWMLHELYRRALPAGTGSRVATVSTGFRARGETPLAKARSAHGFTSLSGRWCRRRSSTGRHGAWASSCIWNRCPWQRCDWQCA